MKYLFDSIEILLSNRRLYNLANALLLLVFTFLIIYPAFVAISEGNDFHLFFQAAKNYQEKKELYTIPMSEGIYYYYYSPLFTLMIQPFLWIGEYVVSPESRFCGLPTGLIVLKGIWSVLNIIMIFRIIIHVNRWFTTEKKLTKLIFWSILMILTYRWLWLNIFWGQLTIFLLWGVLESVLSRGGNLYIKSLILGLITNIKVIPILFYSFLFIKKRWKLFFFSTGTFLLFIIIPFLFSDYFYVYDQTLKWFEAVNPLSKRHVITTGEGGFFDVGSMIVKYFTNIKFKTEPDICLFELSNSGIFRITQIIRLIIFITGLELFRRIKKIGIDSDFIQVAIFCLFIPLLTPHQRDYSFAFFIPSLVFLLAKVFNREYRINYFLVFLFLVSFISMGCIIHFEIFFVKWHNFIYGIRLIGLGGLLYFICFSVFVFDYTKKAGLESVN